MWRGLPTSEMVERFRDGRNIACPEPESGEVVVLHNGLLHIRGGNHSNERRRAVAVCYLDASTRRLGTGATYQGFLGCDGFSDQACIAAPGRDCSRDTHMGPCCREFGDGSGLGPIEA